MALLALAHHSRTMNVSDVDGSDRTEPTPDAEELPPHERPVVRATTRCVRRVRACADHRSERHELEFQVTTGVPNQRTGPPAGMVDTEPAQELERQQWRTCRLRSVQNCEEVAAARSHGILGKSRVFRAAPSGSDRGQLASTDLRVRIRQRLHRGFHRQCTRQVRWRDTPTHYAYPCDI